MLTSWNNDDKNGTSLTVRYFDGTPPEKFTLTNDMMRRDLSTLQRDADAAAIKDYPKTFTKSDPPPVALRSTGGFYMALVHDQFRNPSKDPAAHILTALDEGEEWDSQKKLFEEGGMIVEALKDPDKDGSVLYIGLDGDQVVHVSTECAEGPAGHAAAFDLTYYVVTNGKSDPLAHLLPRFLTGTTLIGTGVSFCYAHLKRRERFVSQGEMSYLGWKTADALVDRPVVLRSLLEDCSDAGRLKARGGETDFNCIQRSAGGDQWECYSAHLLYHTRICMKDCNDWRLSLAPKNQRKAMAHNRNAVMNFIATEYGANLLQDALQYLHVNHPCRPEGVLLDSCADCVSVLLTAERVAFLLWEQSEEMKTAAAAKKQADKRARLEAAHAAQQKQQADERRAADLCRKQRAATARKEKRDKKPVLRPALACNGYQYDQPGDPSERDLDEKTARRRKAAEHAKKVAACRSEVALRAYQIEEVARMSRDLFGS